MSQLVFLLLGVCAATSLAQTEIDLSPDYHLKYQLINDDTEIEFEVTVRTKGWVGFGVRLGAIPGLIDSDLIMGGVHDNSTNYFNDMFGDARVNDTYPVIDDVEDWFIDASRTSENATHTTLVFKRLLNTNDIDHDFEIKNEEINVIWSIGETDNREIQHRTRGSRWINFLGPSAPVCPTTTGGILAQTEINLSPDYHLKYQLANGYTEIEFEVTVRTKGWVGFGVRLGAIPGLIDSDLIMGGVYDDSTTYFNDMFGDARVNDTYPVIDDVEDWFLDASRTSENATHTTLFFRRRLNTNDIDHDFEIKNEDINVIWSIGETDNREIQHRTRGSRWINFICGSATTDPPTYTTTESAASNLESTILFTSIFILHLAQ